MYFTVHMHPKVQNGGIGIFLFPLVEVILLCNFVCHLCTCFITENTG